MGNQRARTRNASAAICTNGLGQDDGLALPGTRARPELERGTFPSGRGRKVGISFHESIAHARAGAWIVTMTLQYNGLPSGAATTHRTTSRGFPPCNAVRVPRRLRVDSHVRRISIASRSARPHTRRAPEKSPQDRGPLRTRGRLLFCVTDDGIGINEIIPRRHGMRLMSYRAQAISGLLDVHPNIPPADHQHARSIRRKGSPTARKHLNPKRRPLCC